MLHTSGKGEGREIVRISEEERKVIITEGKKEDLTRREYSGRQKYNPYNPQLSISALRHDRELWFVLLDRYLP
jgi:hypothetical protein